MTLTISQLASYAGVTVRAVRHYHAKGLLPEPPRDGSGYRRYDAAGTAEHKAACLLEHGHTHFIESDPGQAIEIARRVPVGRIFWLDGRQAISLSAHVAAPLARA